MNKAAISAAVVVLVAGGVATGIVLSHRTSTEAFHILSPERYSKAIPGALHPVGSSMFVTNVASWNQLGTAEKHAVAMQVAEAADELAQGPSMTPASSELTSRAASLAAGRRGAILTAASAAQPTSYPPFDSLQPQPQAAVVEGPGLISAIPCVSYGYTEAGVPLVACGGSVTDLSGVDSGANAASGLQTSGILAVGEFANGWAFDPLTSTYQGLAGLAAGEGQPVNAEFSVTTISLNIGFGVGSCGETDATLVAVNAAAQEYTAGYTPSQQVSLSNCLSTFQVLLPVTEALKTLTAVASVLQSAWSEALSLNSGGWSSACDAMSKGLNLGSLANSIYQVVKSAESTLPGIGVSADCTTTPLAWASPGVITGGSPVGLDVGAMAMAKAVDAIDLGFAFSKVSGCAWGGAVDLTTCPLSSSSPPPTASPSPTPSGSALVISRDTTLSSDISCSNLTIDPGVTLTTNGYNIYCSGTVDNQGTIITGPSAPRNFPLSYGGSGGGSTDLGGPAATGFSTRSAGGTSCSTSGCTAADGSSPVLPGLTSGELESWYLAGMNQYLAGAGGGSSPVVQGGAGANGLFIEANRIIAGTIISAGGDGQNQPGQSSAGSGGGGVVILAYLSSLTPGSYNFSGGYTTTADGTHHEFGGTGAVVARQFASLPITIGTS